MAREKKTVLFNKNEILFERVKDPKTELTQENGYSIEVIHTEHKGKDYPFKEYTETVREKSKLGFYFDRIYTKRMYEKRDISEDHRVILDIYFHKSPKEYYHLSYLYKRLETIISIDTRPWDLGNDSMEDHMIEDLKGVLDKFFEDYPDTSSKSILSHSNINKFYNNEIDKREVSFRSRVKDQLYIDLFGSPKGFLGQTNLGKILSHGFDPNTSFRKRK